MFMTSLKISSYDFTVFAINTYLFPYKFGIVDLMLIIIDIP